MIRKIRNKRLRRLWEDNDPAGLPPQHVARIRRILDRLDASVNPEDMRLPGWQLHPLTGARREEWAVSVSGNWRITFRFDDGDAIDVDYLDYH